MKNRVILLSLLISINFANELHGLKGEYVDTFREKVLLRVSFGKHTDMMFINGNHFDCSFYVPYSFYEKKYPSLYKTKWKPPHSFIYAFNSDDEFCEDWAWGAAVKESILFIIIEDDGWVFDNYSEIVAVSNVSIRNIAKVVDNPLQYGKLLFKK